MYILSNTTFQITKTKKEKKSRDFIKLNNLNYKKYHFFNPVQSDYYKISTVGVYWYRTLAYAYCDLWRRELVREIGTVQ